MDDEEDAYVNIVPNKQRLRLMTTNQLNRLFRRGTIDQVIGWYQLLVVVVAVVLVVVVVVVVGGGGGGSSSSSSSSSGSSSGEEDDDDYNLWGRKFCVTRV